ncbi:MAG: hypothetical protein KC502_00885 [Myxococcales bacterium]|nr:hypothetical protein [Myxococcales bacterium]
MRRIAPFRAPQTVLARRSAVLCGLMSCVMAACGADVAMEEPVGNTGGGGWAFSSDAPSGEVQPSNPDTATVSDSEGAGELDVQSFADINNIVDIQVFADATSPAAEDAGVDCGAQFSGCLIDGKCEALGAINPASPCEVCEPSKSADQWSPRPNCCQSDADCKKASVCDAPTCDLVSATCKPGKKLGCCTADFECSDNNLCTIDTCSPTTGECKITPKTCSSASACQDGVCDGVTGQCGQQLKAGWCFIGGACVSSGKAQPGTQCGSCSPATDATNWSDKAGTPCDDGNVCSFGDACDGKGQCVGSPTKDCCKTDLDCASLASACVTATCNQTAHVCIKTTKANCCESGACCEPATNKLKPSGTLCGGSVIASQYQCSGQQIQRRSVYPGCTGLDAKTCSQDAKFSYKGPWSGVKTCASNTTCTQTASGVMPTCKPKEPTGTCKGACGGPAADGTCHCGASCTTLGNCCKDYMSTCGCTGGGCCDVAKKFLYPKGKACGSKVQYQCSGKTIQKRTMNAVCSGTSSVCPVGTYGSWANVQTCGSGTTCTVNSSKTAASCKATGGSCVGICGKQSPSGCWCDDKCSQYGDCCGDFSKTCACGANPLSSCNGKCGGKGAGGCWCDANCVILKDCCDDKPKCCG